MLIAMLFPAPATPAFPPGQAATNPLFPRYEDCTQDGRLNTLAIPPAFATLFMSREMRALRTLESRANGLVPLLTRLTVTSLDQPIRVNRPFEAACGYVIAHDRDASGAVTRLFLNVWADVRGRPHIPAAERQAGGGRELATAGHAFAEHTYTRPFAPPGQRRVTSFAGIPGAPEVPEMRYHQPAPTTAGDAPEGATWLDELAPDAVDTRFLLDHSDANQHVNSGVYVRLYLDAVGRRLAASGHKGPLRSRAFDIAYRKPSFVGERVRAHIRLFTLGNLIGGAGFLAAVGEEARPRCYVRALYGP